MRFKNGEYYTKLNSVRHWYKIGGAEHNTTPLLVIHGGPSGNQILLEHTIGKELEKYSTVIYYEQRGCGRSDWPENENDYSINHLVEDIEKLRRHLSIEKLIILGTSFGGEIALEYSLAHGNHVEKLILQGPVDGNWERLRFTQYIGYQTIAEGKVKEDIESIINSEQSLDEKNKRLFQVINPETMLSLSLHNKANLPVALQFIEKMNQYPFNENYQRVITERKAIFPSLLDRIQHMNIPTLIIVGLYDRNTGVEMSRDIHERIHQSKLVILHHSAHYPEVDELVEYSQKIKEFII